MLLQLLMILFHDFDFHFVIFSKYFQFHHLYISFFFVRTATILMRQKSELSFRPFFF